MDDDFHPYRIKIGETRKPTGLKNGGLTCKVCISNLYKFVYLHNLGEKVSGVAQFEKHLADQLGSDENPGWLGNIRDYTTQLYRDYFRSHEIRIPIDQPL